PIEKITGKIIGYQFIKRLILKELFSKEQRPYLRMLVYLSLLDSPVDICKVVIKKVLPSPAEIRLRYNLPHNSLKILPYYLFNPFIMMFKSVKR
ncbi:MAG: hypothetical protein Q8K68_08530, partial [Nitrospirota bacterium]|nr:hypothetical protein [Nitrospirota bacterium]